MDPKELNQNSKSPPDFCFKLENLQKIVRLDELSELKSQIANYSVHFCKHANLIWDGVGELPFQILIDEVEQRIQKLFPLYYSKYIPMSKNEIVNGYALYNLTENLFSYDLYLELLKLWNVEDMTMNQFMKTYDETARCDWDKIDENGDTFKGYWEYPDTTIERKNAGDLTRAQNGKSLWNLPYPKKVLLKTIQIGCNNRLECVRYSNFICEWMKRKIKQMEELEKTENKN